ncbi:MAG TPA: hypothetical protein VHT73_02090 [Thermodesulfobacteriota bacterium]|nr:hypothetical protein [Thermodesulfobacteriota bacterium]
MPMMKVVFPLDIEIPGMGDFITSFVLLSKEKESNVSLYLQMGL